MKKRNLKNLALNKKSISNLKINGGSPIAPVTLSEYDVIGCLSQNGCTTGPDETMSCRDWSCGCPQR